MAIGQGRAAVAVDVDRRHGESLAPGIPQPGLRTVGIGCLAGPACASGIAIPVRRLKLQPAQLDFATDITPLDRRRAAVFRSHISEPCCEGEFANSSRCLWRSCVEQDSGSQIVPSQIVARVPCSQNRARACTLRRCIKSGYCKISRSRSCAICSLPFA